MTNIWLEKIHHPFAKVSGFADSAVINKNKIACNFDSFGYSREFTHSATGVYVFMFK